MKNLSTPRLVSFAWEMSDLIDADALANPRRPGEPEPEWVTYARRLEKQAFAEVSKRHRLNGELS